MLRRTEELRTGGIGIRGIPGHSRVVEAGFDFGGVRFTGGLGEAKEGLHQHHFGGQYSGRQDEEEEEDTCRKADPNSCQQHIQSPATIQFKLPGNLVQLRGGPAGYLGEARNGGMKVWQTNMGEHRITRQLKAIEHGKE